MTHPADPTHPDMAWHLRRLLEAVKEAACGLEGRWGWLAGPMALLAWMWTRRQRREAAEAMQAVQGMLAAFLGLIEDFRAGRLVAENAPEEKERPATDGVVAGPISAPALATPAASVIDVPARAGGGAAAIEGARACAFLNKMAGSAAGVAWPGQRLGPGFRRDDEEQQCDQMGIAIGDVAPPWASAPSAVGSATSIAHPAAQGSRFALRPPRWWRNAPVFAGHFRPTLGRDRRRRAVLKNPNTGSRVGTSKTLRYSNDISGVSVALRRRHYARRSDRHPRAKLHHAVAGDAKAGDGDAVRGGEVVAGAE